MYFYKQYPLTSLKAQLTSGCFLKAEGGTFLKVYFTYKNNLWEHPKYINQIFLFCWCGPVILYFNMMLYWSQLVNVCWMRDIFFSIFWKGRTGRTVTCQVGSGSRIWMPHNISSHFCIYLASLFLFVHILSSRPCVFILFLVFFSSFSSHFLSFSATSSAANVFKLFLHEVNLFRDTMQNTKVSSTEIKSYLIRNVRTYGVLYNWPLV